MHANNIIWMQLSLSHHLPGLQMSQCVKMLTSCGQCRVCERQVLQWRILDYVSFLYFAFMFNGYRILLITEEFYVHVCRNIQNLVSVPCSLKNVTIVFVIAWMLETKFTSLFIFPGLTFPSLTFAENVSGEGMSNLSKST